MPDQNPADPTAPGQVTSFKDMGPAAEPPPPPAMDGSDLPPAPPIVEPAPAEAPPIDDTGGATPTFDISSSISGTPPPKKKFGGGRFIATILGLLVLVGGLGAGIILVQQQQDIRQRASGTEPCRTCSNKKCLFTGEKGTCNSNLDICKDDSGCQAPIPTATRVPTPPTPTATQTPSPPPPTPTPTPKCTDTPGQFCNDVTCSQDGLSSGSGTCPGGLQRYCCKSKTTPTPTPTPTGVGQCSRVSQVFADHNAASITVSQAMMNECTSKCSDGKLWVSRYKCNGINLSQGCQDNGEVLTWDAKVGQTFSASSPTCGTIQVDVGCKNAANTYGNVGGVSKGAAQACSTPTTPPGSPTAQCLNIRAFDTNWTELTVPQLSQLKAGNKVRFTVGGTTTSGSFDKAKFKINGLERAEVAGKKPASQDFYDEYTIPEGVTTFTINAQIHHSSLGWSN